MWKKGGPDTSEMATSKRVRISSPKDGDTICFFSEWRINMNNKQNSDGTNRQTYIHELSSLFIIVFVKRQKIELNFRKMKIAL